MDNEHHQNRFHHDIPGKTHSKDITHLFASTIVKERSIKCPEQHRSAISKRSSGISTRPFISRILQLDLSSSQKELHTKTDDHKPETFEQITSDPKVQNANFSTSQEPHHSGSLCNVHRPAGWVFTHSGSSEIQKVPQVHLEQEDLSISSASVRPFDRPLYIHEDSGTTCFLGTSEGHTTPQIPGRLAHSAQRSNDTAAAYAMGFKHGKRSGISHKFRKIRSTPQTEVHLLGDEFRPSSGKSVNPSGKETYSTNLVKKDVVREGMASIFLGENSGSPHKHSGPSIFRQIKSQTAPGLFHSELEQDRSITKYYPESGSQRDYRLVDSTDPRLGRSQPSSQDFPETHVYGCIPRRMGCTSGVSHSVGFMDRNGQRTSHKSFRDESNHSRLCNIQRPIKKHKPFGSLRQHNCDCVYQQTGRNEIHTSPSSDQDSV